MGLNREEKIVSGERRRVMPSSHFYVQSYGLLRFATVQVLRKTVGNRGVLGYV